MFEGGGTEAPNIKNARVGVFLVIRWKEGRAEKHADTKNASKRMHLCYWQGGGESWGAGERLGGLGGCRGGREAAQHENMPTPGMFSSWSAGEAAEHKKRACGHVLHVRRQGGQEGLPVRHPRCVFMLGFKGGVRGHLNTKIVPSWARFSCWRGNMKGCVFMLGFKGGVGNPSSRTRKTRHSVCFSCSGGEKLEICQYIE